MAHKKRRFNTEIAKKTFAVPTMNTDRREAEEDNRKLYYLRWGSV